MKINIPEEITSALQAHKILFDEPMSSHTSIGTGGRAAVMIIPDTLSELSLVIKELRLFRNIAVIGSGTCLLVSDDGYKGIVIKTSKIKGIERYGRYVTALAGDTLREISDAAFANGLTGMEWAAADGGTLGAAIASNAAHFGAEIRDSIYVAEVITRDGELLTLQESGLNMRSGNTDVSKKGYTLLRAILHFERGDEPLMWKHMNEYRARSCVEEGKAATGAVFSDTQDAGGAAGLIAECGLSGRTSGGASVSRKSPNYIINDGSASSRDVLRLINDITVIVMKKKGVRLKHNLRLLGRF